ncbi:MAG: hypothetical protein M3Z05_16520 [Gemmatimonadota bacterium]|nr:hypothetical protein [Gemmatimonadota bacterium]
MSRLQKVILGGCSAVVAFDVLASLASVAFHFPYVRATVGSFLLFVAIGFLAARARATRRIRAAALAGATCGLIDSSVGWYLSTAIGASAPGLPLTLPRWLIIAATGMLFSTIFACMGGAVGAYRQPRGHRAG